MRKLLSVATLVAVGAGTVGAGALDNVELKGSDTLFTISNLILDNCPGADPGLDGVVPGLIYEGTGSSNGEQMVLDTGVPGTGSSGIGVAGGCTLPDCGTIAPMSRFLESTRTCNFPEVLSAAPNEEKDASRAEGLSFALDGLSIVTSGIHAATCNPGPEDCDKTSTPDSGIGFSDAVGNTKSFTVTDQNGDGLVTCPTAAACPAGTYTIAATDPQGAAGWKDVIRIIYAGLPSGLGSANSAIATRDCNGDLRRSLVASWANMYQNECSGGACAGLRHAFRRNDESGTTDVFLALLSLPSLNIATGQSVFCNVAQTGDSVQTVGDVPWSNTTNTVYTSAARFQNGTATACATDADCDTAAAQPGSLAAVPGQACVSGFCAVRNAFPGGASPARPGQDGGTGWCSAGLCTANTQCGTQGACERQCSVSLAACYLDAHCPGGETCTAGTGRCISGECTAPANCGTSGGVCGPTWSPGYNAPPAAPYVSDFQDNDPIRVTCAGDFNIPAGGGAPSNAAAEQVCRNRRAKVPGVGNALEPAGNLGLVLSTEPPPPDVPIEDSYPSTPCTFGVFDLGDAPVRPTGQVVNDPDYPAATRSLIRVDRCPNGDIPQLLLPGSGKCLVPVNSAIINANTTPSGDARCLNGKNNVPQILVDSGFANLHAGINAVRTNAGGTGGDGDGRAYNLVLRRSGGQILLTARQGALVPVLGAFYRIHSTRTLLTPGTCAGGICCQDTSATRQIGCLVQASPCSMGFAGREAADIVLLSDQAGTESAISQRLNALEATDLCVRKLIDPPTTDDPYPFSRQLYANAMLGFENLTGQELEFAKCYAGGVDGGLAEFETLVSAGANFIPRGAAGSNPPACQDFRQQNILGVATTPAGQHGCNQLCGSGSDANPDDDACNNNDNTIACPGCPGGTFPSDDPNVVGTTLAPVACN